jgi:tetratricopeptide (TPR) repeat protein
VGTLPYMAPEQLQGEPVDARTDIHALGLVLYEMASGRRLFQQNSIPQLTDAILHQQPVTPRAFNARVSPELERIILKCLEKEPENRYQSAKELSVDLRHLGAPHTVAPAPAAALAPARSRRSLWPLLAGAAALVVAATAGAYFYFHRAPKLTDKDTIVLADFTNTTGDPVFDGALRQGLAVQLEQSPFLSLISDERIQQTLRLMGQPADAHLTPDLANQICQRNESTAVLDGSIASLGNQYVLGLRAKNCHTGDVLAEEQVQAARKEDVLNALSQIASTFRTRIGESLATVEKHATPLAEATTPSLEALKAYSLGLAQFSRGDPTSAIPLLQHAIELDPEFASAYAALGRAHQVRGEAVLTEEAIRKAYALRNRASEREKLDLTAVYYQFATGQIDLAIQTCELWKQTYPRDFVPHRLLGFEYATLGRWEESAQEFGEANRIDPSQYLPYAGLIQDYMALNRLADAHAIYQQAKARGLGGSDFEGYHYALAFLEGDTRMMAEIAASQLNFEGTEAETEAYLGHIGKARELSRRAADAALRAGAKEAAAYIRANAALREALLGNSAAARQNASAALTGSGTASGHASTGWSASWSGALALALIGDSAQAGTLSNQFAAGHPSDTVINNLWLPEIHSVIKLNEGRGAQAVDELAPAAALELSWVSPQLMPAYLRGQAYLATHSGLDAAREFQKVLDHPGIVFYSPIAVLAHLQIGRAMAMQGDTAKAHAAYQDFLTLWKDADPDIPILKQAKAEYAKLR